MTNRQSPQSLDWSDSRHDTSPVCLYACVVTCQVSYNQSGLFLHWPWNKWTCELPEVWCQCVSHSFFSINSTPIEQGYRHWIQEIPSAGLFSFCYSDDVLDFPNSTRTPCSKLCCTHPGEILALPPKVRWCEHCWLENIWFFLHRTSAILQQAYVVQVKYLAKVSLSLSHY